LMFVLVTPRHRRRWLWIHQKQPEWPAGGAI